MNIFSYGRRIILDKAYVYHVSLPEKEATVLLSKSNEGWFVEEIEGHSNTSASPYIQSFVTQWLKKDSS
jgi:hypothetical protein